MGEEIRKKRQQFQCFPLGRKKLKLESLPILAALTSGLNKHDQRIFVFVFLSVVFQPLT